MKKSILALASLLTVGINAQELDEHLTVEHAECTYFGPSGAKMRNEVLNAARVGRYSRETIDVRQAMSFVPGGSRTSSL